jgi:hypothetical protein
LPAGDFAGGGGGGRGDEPRPQVPAVSDQLFASPFELTEELLKAVAEGRQVHGRQRRQ